MEHIFKVVDFNIYNEKKINTDEDEDDVEAEGVLLLLEAIWLVLAAMLLFWGITVVELAIWLTAALVLVDEGKDIIKLLGNFSQIDAHGRSLLDCCLYLITI